MTLFPRFRAALLVLAVGLTACGSDETTVGDVLAEIGAAWCDRAVECGLADESERGQCEDVFHDAGCEGGDCSAEFEGSDARVDACVEAFGSFACDFLSNGLLPTACQDF
jgi:hypothetical protein